LNSYTLYWGPKSWAKYSELTRGAKAMPIDYVAAAAKWPFTDIRSGDEVFVVNVLDGELRVGGRLVAEGGPVSKEVAKKTLGDDKPYEWDSYVLGRAEFDAFRSNLRVPLNISRKLNLIDAHGSVENPVNKGGDGIEHMSFANCRLLSKESANELRKLVGLVEDPKALELMSDLDEIDADANSGTDDPTERMDNRLSRIGQGKFRRNTILTWGGEEKCAVTGIALPALLNASHIVPWSEDASKRKLGSNGVLLAAHLDRLFDRNLIGFYAVDFRDTCELVVAPRLKSSFALLSRIGISDRSCLDLTTVKRVDVGTLKANLSFHMARVRANL
jgi:hypothetical protein